MHLLQSLQKQKDKLGTRHQNYIFFFPILYLNEQQTESPKTKTHIQNTFLKKFLVQVEYCILSFVTYVHFLYRRMEMRERERETWQSWKKGYLKISKKWT